MAVREGPLETDAGTAMAFFWETRGVRLKLKSTLVNPSEQALSCKAKEPKVLYCPSSISICSWLLFFLEGIAFEIVFERDT